MQLFKIFEIINIKVFKNLYFSKNSNLARPVTGSSSNLFLQRKSLQFSDSFPPAIISQIKFLFNNAYFS